MNRNKFMTYVKIHPYIECRICKRKIKISNFSYRDIHDDDTGICKSCSWIDRNNHKIAYKDYPYELIHNIVMFIFESENCILNQLEHKLNIKLEEIIDIVQHLNIGNKTYMLETKCECCGNKMLIHPSKMKKNHYNYCSSECYWKDKPNKVPKGKDNSQYNRIITNCTNCGAKIERIKSVYNLKNRYNDNHNFCCRECYWKYRSKYYIDEKSNGKYLVWTDELKNKMRIKKLEELSKDERLNTKPQKEVNSILSDLKIDFIREYKCVYYSIDNYLSHHNLMIEVMGDYWHANPIKFNEHKYLMTQKQFDGIHRDKIKKSYILNHYNINILYLWEDDILKRRKLCSLLILEYINSKGQLQNYHSFNYEICDNILKLKDILVIPYQDKNINEYRTLLKNIS